MDDGGALELVGGLDVARALLDQDLDDVQVAQDDGVVERRHLHGVGALDVGALLDEQLDGLDLVLAHGQVERRVVRALGLAVDVGHGLGLGFPARRLLLFFLLRVAALLAVLVVLLPLLHLLVLLLLPVEQELDVVEAAPLRGDHQRRGELHIHLCVADAALQ